MEKMIRNLLGVGAALALLLSATPAAAQCCPQPSACCDPCCDPCMDWCDMCGNWEVGAHALYFTPIACPFNYGIHAEDATQGDELIVDSYGVKCRGDWGFRLFGKYLSDCSFFGVGYQWFQASAANSEEGDLLKIRGANPATSRISGKTRFEYQNFDARVGKYLHRGCGCNFYLFGNARWVDLSYKRSARQVVSPAGTTHYFSEKSELQGGAIGIGTGAEFDLWCDVGLFGEANLLGVIADRQTKDVHAKDVNDTRGGVRYGSDTCISPEANFRIGLNYTYTCGCWTFVGELGFEVDYFWNAVAFPGVVDPGMSTDVDDPWILECQDVGFSGLFFGGKVLF